MKLYSLLLIVLFCTTASAEVFKRIGPDGEVYFSDRAGSDAAPVDVTPAQTVSLPAVPEQTDAAPQPNDTAPSYTEFAIVSPTDDEGVRANDGNVPVSLSLRPELMPGHTITLKIDGEDGKQVHAGEGLTIELSNLSRGRHTVEARVVNETGDTLIQSGLVGFNVLRVAGG